MTGRWIAVATGLLGVFLVSIAVGGYVARQLRGQPSVPPVAVATSPPASIATPNLMTESPTATQIRGTTAAPSPTPTSRPTRSPLPSPTPAPPTATPAPSLDPPTAEAFATDLAAAITRADRAYLVDRLHPAVVERYGLQQCRRYIRDNVAGDVANWEVQASAGPEPWDYVTDDLTTTVADAWSVTVRQPEADPETRDLHFAPAGGTWRWFTDCGNPA